MGENNLQKGATGERNDHYWNISIFKLAVDVCPILLMNLFPQLAICEGVIDCSLMSNEQSFSNIMERENKLHFNEMMMMISALY